MLKVRSLVVGSIAALAASGIAAMPAAAAGLTARGSIGQAYVLGAEASQSVSLLNSRGKVVGTGTTDRFGSFIFLNAAPGKNYSVRAGSKLTKKFTVLSTKSNPSAAFFKSKKLKEGLNYVKVRDGLELAMTVRLPAGAKSLADGPFPTIVEYSGYQTAAPHKLALGGSNDPLAPASSTATGSLIAPLLGFAVVSVQMRGSGCSAGAFDLFGLPTTYDGYDAIETVGSQSWVKGHKVGMAGISFSGITQLFTAGTRPKHLAAITPMSVTDDTYTATGFPGGINNTGFALSWVRDRMSDAEPAPEGGQPWAKALVNAGDTHCIENQKLRLQTRDAVKVSDDNPYRTPSEFDQRSPGAWVSKINVPTFWIGQYQDEQTGGHFVESLAALKKNPNVWISLQNGVHADSLGPSTITRWAEFLNLFVADRIPKLPTIVMKLSDALYTALAGAPAAKVLQSRYAAMTDVKAAKKMFKRDPRVRLLMDNGAGPEGLGSIGATWELGYDAWPIRQVRPKTYYLGPNGDLTASKPAASTTSYVSDPSARPLQTLYGIGAGDDWKAQPRYDWAPLASGKGIGFATAALSRDTVISGPSSLDLYLKSSARDTDLQVTLSEVRPDGKETYIQNGWLRASHRKLDAKKSTVLDPFPTHLKQDAALLPANDVFTLVRVPVFPVSHAFRAGSKIRVTVEAPGGDRAIWKFATIDDGTTTNTISLGGVKASKMILPVIAGATAKGTPRPAPTALRGQPSRDYVAADNGR